MSASRAGLMATLALGIGAASLASGCASYIELEGHEQFIQAISFSPGGHRIASGSDDATARVWATDDGEELRTLLGHTGGVWGIGYTADGKTIVTASVDGTVRLWSARHGRLEHTLGDTSGEEEQPPALAVAVNPVTDTFAVSYDDNITAIWSLTDRSLLRRIPGGGRMVSAIAYHPEGKLLATTNGDRVRILSADDGRLVRILAGPGGLTHAVAFSPDGARIACGADDGKARVWDVETGEVVRTIEVEGETHIRGVAFDPTGRLVATGNWTGEVDVWRIADGVRVGGYDGQYDRIRAVVWAADGSKIAAAGGDESIRIWPVPSEVLEAAADGGPSQ